MTIRTCRHRGRVAVHFVDGRHVGRLYLSADEAAELLAQMEGE